MLRLSGCCFLMLARTYLTEDAFREILAMVPAQPRSLDP